MHIRVQSTVPVCVDWSQKGDGNLGPLSEVLLLSSPWGEEGHFPNRQHPCFPALLLGLAFLLAVQQAAEPGKVRGWGWLSLEVCCGNGCVEVLHSSCHENFPELIHVIVPGDWGCDWSFSCLQSLWQCRCHSRWCIHTHSRQMLGDTASRLYFQAVSFWMPASPSWGLIFRGNERFTQWLK